MTVQEYNHDFLPKVERAREFVLLFESSIDHMDDALVDKNEVRRHFKTRSWSEETKQTILTALSYYKKREGLDRCTPDPEKSDYDQGYQQALADISKPMAVIAKNWNPSVCPRCKQSMSDFEPCFDGYYNRATNLDRCPFCGQRLDWSEV